MSPAASTKRPAKQAASKGSGSAKQAGSKGSPAVKPGGSGGSDAATPGVAQGTGTTAAELRWTAELDELGRAFRRVFRSLNRLRGRDTHLGGSELSHAQFELLIELDERGGLSAGELAAAARLTPATVTQMLEHLAGCGHVERVRSDIDRRVVVSRLTAQGTRKIEAKRAAWQERWQRALEGMGPRELDAATRVLQRLGDAFEDAPAVEACPEPPREVGSLGAQAKTARNPLL
jgi:DNA-binding MarR family transcriptional regulator